MLNRGLKKNIILENNETELRKNSKYHTILTFQSRHFQTSTLKLPTKSKLFWNLMSAPILKEIHLVLV